MEPPAITPFTRQGISDQLSDKLYIYIHSINALISSTLLQELLALNVFSLSLSFSLIVSIFGTTITYIHTCVCVCLIQILLQCRTDCLLSYSDFELNSFGLSFDLFLYFRIMMSITILKITFTKIFLAVFKMNLLKKWF